MGKVFAVFMALVSIQVLASTSQTLDLARPGEVLVKIRKGQVGKFLAKKSFLGVEVIKELRLLTGEYFLLSGKESVSTLVKSFHAMPEVEIAEPNFKYRTSGTTSSLRKFFFPQRSKSSSAPNDPLYSWQWGMHNTGDNEPNPSRKIDQRNLAGIDIQAESAWSLAKGSRKVIVGVVDSGIDVTHPDLRSNIWVNKNEIPNNAKDDDNNGYIDDVYGWSGLTNSGNVTDGTGHGTHCAGTIGAEHDNGIGIAGVMSEVSIMALKFIDEDGFGSTADAVEVIDYGIRMGVNVLSNSWGGGPYSLILENIILKARDRGILFIAASGNDGISNDLNLYYPANYPFSNVIAVANHTGMDQLSIYSNYGANNVQVAAPGNMILSTIPGGGYQVRSGTSMATPYVAGAMGLLISEEGNLPVADLRERLLNSVIKSKAYQNKVKFQGRLNLYQLLTK